MGGCGQHCTPQDESGHEVSISVILTKPSAVRLNPPRLRFRTLEFLCLNNVAVLVANGFGSDAILGQQLHSSGLGGISIEVLSLDLLETVRLDASPGGRG